MVCTRLLFIEGPRDISDRGRGCIEILLLSLCVLTAVHQDHQYGFPVCGRQCPRGGQPLVGHYSEDETGCRARNRRAGQDR